MKRLAITSSDSGGGCLKSAKIADRVFATHYCNEMVSAPAPFTLDPLHYFDERARLASADTEDWELELFTGLPAALNEIKSTAADYDRVELWMDPTPGGQLLLIQLIDYFQGYGDPLPNLFLANVARRLGNEAPGPWLQRVVLQPIEPSTAAFASEAWAAFRQPTPQPWCELLDAAPFSLPAFPAAALRLLEDLPHVRSGLTETERGMLSYFANQGRTFRQLNVNLLYPCTSAVGYWQFGRIFAALGHCRRPLLTGVSEPEFTLALHDDNERHAGFFKADIDLTEFGRAVFHSKEDNACHNTIDRWWGGTRLTNGSLWRWNPETRSVVTPD